jgi:glycolate oxidase FAD binding subunit
MSIERRLPLTHTLAPANEADVAEAVRAAYADKTPVYPLGGGTSLDYGAQAVRPGVGVSLQKLSRLVDYRPEDMTVTVEAGMDFATLSKTLMKRRQHIAIEVARPDRTTIGGAVAVNPLGPRQFSCGTLRDCVVGFTAVDGQGAVFSGGGRVLKNAAGYNMGRLLAGSLGTLGIITQLTLMVRPVPEMSALAACDLADLETAERLLAKLMQSSISPAAVELSLGPGRRENPVLVSMPQPTSAGPTAGTNRPVRLIVGFEGPSASVQWMLDSLREMWLSSGVVSPMTVTNAWAKSLWNWLADFPAQVQIAVLPSAVTRMIGSLTSLDPDCTIQAHAGSGILRAVFSEKRLSEPETIAAAANAVAQGAPPSSEDKTDNSQAESVFGRFLRGKLRPMVEECGGKLTVLSSPQGSRLSCRDVWGPRGDGFAVMQSIKDRFDPAGILNPGRFIFDAP